MFRWLLSALLPRGVFLENERLNTMSLRPTNFPFAEGIGIFVGVLAWNLLSEGRLDILNALVIAVPRTLAWFALRRWKQKSGKSHR